VHQLLLRPYPLLARLLFVVLTVIIVPFLAGILAQAEESNSTNRPDQVNSGLQGSPGAGAHWLGPWEEGGPKVLDTRRPAPPAKQVDRPPAPASPQSPNLPRTTVSPPAISADQYWHEPWAWNFYGPRQFYPFGLYGYDRRLWQGRSHIWAGRGFFRGSHPGFHGRSFRGRGFKGGSFWGR
jgi:hypothetical protein